MNMINIVIDVLQALIFSLFSFCYVRKKENHSNYLVLTILFIMLAVEILWFDYNVTYEGFASIAYSLTVFIILKFIVIGNNLELIILAFILNIVISVGNGVAVAIITLVLGYSMIHIVNSNFLQIIGGVISTISIICISIVIIRSKKYIINMLTPYSNYFLAIIVLLYISITFLEELLFSQKYNEYMILLSLISFLSLFSLFLILMFKQAKDNSITVNEVSIRKELEFIDEKMGKVEQYNTKLSTMRHDLARIFFILKNYISNSEEDKAIEVLNALLEETNVLPKLVITGNSIVDAIITSKSVDCADLGIEFSYKIDPSHIKCFREFDIAILLLNVLANAIENVDKSKKKITLNISNKNNKMIINVTNTVQIEVLKYNPKMITTKTDDKSHGFGILSMRNIAEKYNGEVLFKQEQMVFSCLIILNYPAD